MVEQFSITDSSASIIGIKKKKYFLHKNVKRQSGFHFNPLSVEDFYFCEDYDKVWIKERYKRFRFYEISLN